MLNQTYMRGFFLISLVLSWSTNFSIWSWRNFTTWLKCIHVIVKLINWFKHLIWSNLIWVALELHGSYLIQLTLCDSFHFLLSLLYQNLVFFVALDWFESTFFGSFNKSVFVQRVNCLFSLFQIGHL